MGEEEIIYGYVTGDLFQLHNDDKINFTSTKKFGDKKPVFSERMYSLEYVIQQNSTMKLRGLVIEIDPLKTFRLEKLEKDEIDKVNSTRERGFAIPNKVDNFDKVIESIKYQYFSLKEELGIDFNKTYQEAKQYSKKFKASNNIYLEWLEDTYEQFLSFEKPFYSEIIEEKTSEEIEEEIEEELLNSLIEEAKELGIATSGKSTINSLQKKIKEYEETQNTSGEV